MTDDSDQISVNPGYALGQLARALISGGQQAAARVQQWRMVISGMRDGTLAVGHRAPVQNTPPWVTLEVAHGGFATGSLAASGPLQAHEEEKLRSLDARERLDLNLHFASEKGREELDALLSDGRYRISLPEEGALLIAAWLLEKGEEERAQALLETITPFFDRLRFYPVPHRRPLPRRVGVYRWTVGQSLESLRSRRPQSQLACMTEAIRVWAPLYDRAVSLFLQTVQGPLPHLGFADDGYKRADGQPVLLGGWPCRHYPDGWSARAAALLHDYSVARAAHSLCEKPEKKKENFARLRGYLATCLEDPSRLTGRDVGQIRKILAGYLSRRGAPDSEKLRALRARQGADVAAPTHLQLAQLLINRLEDLPGDEGSSDVAAKLGPLSEEEANAVQGRPGLALPLSLVRRAEMSWEAPVETLVEKGLLSSSESLAGVLPMLTARVKADAIADPRLSRAFEAVYGAFRRRRSLLLLSYQSQVRIEELPWVAAIEPWLGGGEQARQDAREVLHRLAKLALTSFPHTVLPNKLVKELRALAVDAGQPQPFVEELAADIFMGSFSPVFLKAAKVAAGLLRGTLYERYYEIPYDWVADLDETSKEGLAEFSTICWGLAESTDRSASSAAQNGTVIEQAQILTTHNLAVLLGPLGVRMEDALVLMARRCFQEICHRQSLPMRDWRALMQVVKDSAYAWRQMLFYLSLSDSQDFLPWARDHLARQTESFRQRFAPVMAGLEAVAAGHRFDAAGLHLESGGRRFLGWSTRRHWLLPPSPEPDLHRS